MRSRTWSQEYEPRKPGTRSQSLQTLRNIHLKLDQCSGLVQEVREIGDRMKRTPIMKPGNGKVENIPPLTIEANRGDQDGQIGIGTTTSVRTRSQTRKPPVSPSVGDEVEDRTEMTTSEGKVRMIIMQEDVGDIPQLSKDELIHEIPLERRMTMGLKEVMLSWQVLAEELGITKKELDNIVEMARNIVDMRISTYKVQLFKVVVSAMLRKGGQGSLLTNRQRVTQELQKAVRCGDVSEEQVRRAKEMEPVKQGEKREDIIKIEKEERRYQGLEEVEIKGIRHKGREEEMGKKKYYGKESKRDRNAQRLRTQLGGLYSSDSESGSESGTSDSSKESNKRYTRKSRKGKKSGGSSTDRSTSSDVSPRREKQRRDKEYLQAVRATRPGKYNGDTQKPQALTSWITQMTQYFSLMTLSRRDEVRIAISYLEEEASTWWSQVPKGRKERIKSWKGLRDYIIREFLPHDYNLALWRKLDMTYQRTSVAEYVARFHEIQRQLYDLPKKVAKTKLINGLKPTIRGHVLALRPRTQREVIRLARNFDEAFFSRTLNGIGDKNQWGGDRFQNKGRLNMVGSEVGEDGEINVMMDRNSENQKREFRKPVKSNPPEKKQFKCFNCGKTGHMARECWAPRKPFNRASVNTSTPKESKDEKDLKEKPQ